MKSVLIVSGCDSGYFPFLCELWASIEDSGASSLADFGVLDLGLTEQQDNWLKERKIRSVTPPWPFKGLAGNVPEWFKAMVCRPFLPSYFSEYQFVIWIDADSWIQDADVLEMFVEGARADGFSVVPDVDRCYSSVWTLDWQRERLKMGYGSEEAEKYYKHPIIPTGAICGAANAPHWQYWQRYLYTALQRKVFREAEQTALSLLVHKKELPFHFLPSYCHWLCNQQAPSFDTVRNRYVETYIPYKPIGVMGLADDTKQNPVLVEQEDGVIVPRVLRYKDYRNNVVGKLGLSGNIDANSQHNIKGIYKPKFLEKMFEQISDGRHVSFIQVGAMDGVSFDPIHNAVRQYGWQGVLVEPLPDIFEKLQQNYMGCAGLKFEMAVVTETGDRQDIYRVNPDSVASGELPSWALGISSLLPERNALDGKDVPDNMVEAIRKNTVKQAVEGITFEGLVKKHSVETIDVLQIDTEGYDYKVLCQVDLKKYRPRLIQLEFYNLLETEKQACLALLEEHNYSCYLSINKMDLLAIESPITG